MQRVRLLGRIANISLLGEISVLRRNTFTMEEPGKGNQVSRTTVGDWEQDEKTLQPMTHILQVPGKQFAPKITHAYTYWLQVPADQLIVAKEIAHMVHYASILIDDIQDNSILRRGIPAAHTIYGIPSTINAANYLLLKGLKRVQSLNHPDAQKIYTKQLMEMFYGQGLDIFWRDNYKCPSLEEYKQMSKRKSAAWLGGILLLQLLSDNKTDFMKLNSILALYMQIRNDYGGLCLQEYMDGKGYCEDIAEGKFSFPIIHAIMSHPDDHQVIRILQQRTHDLELKKYCVTLLEKFGSLSYTRQTLEELDAEARAEVAKLGGNPMLEDVLDEVQTWKRETGDKNSEE